MPSLKKNECRRGHVAVFSHCLFVTFDSPGRHAKFEESFIIVYMLHLTATGRHTKFEESFITVFLLLQLTAAGGHAKLEDDFLTIYLLHLAACRD